MKIGFDLPWPLLSYSFNLERPKIVTKIKAKTWIHTFIARLNLYFRLNMFYLRLNVT